LLTVHVLVQKPEGHIALRKLVFGLDKNCWISKVKFKNIRPSVRLPCRRWLYYYYYYY